MYIQRSKTQTRGIRKSSRDCWDAFRRARPWNGRCRNTFAITQTESRTISMSQENENIIRAGKILVRTDKVSLKSKVVLTLGHFFL